MAETVDAAPFLAPRTMPDPERQRIAARYHHAGRRTFLLTRPVAPLVLLIVYASGWSAALDATLSGRFAHAWMVVAAYGLVLGALLTLIGLPASLYRGFVLPRRYGLMRQSLRGWLADYAKGLAL